MRRKSERRKRKEDWEAGKIARSKEYWANGSVSSPCKGRRRRSVWELSRGLKQRALFFRWEIGRRLRAAFRAFAKRRAFEGNGETI